MREKARRAGHAGLLAGVLHYATAPDGSAEPEPSALPEAGDPFGSAVPAAAAPSPAAGVDAVVPPSSPLAASPLAAPPLPLWNLSPGLTLLPDFTGSAAGLSGLTSGTLSSAGGGVASGSTPALSFGATGGVFSVVSVASTFFSTGST